ncbi:MAG: TolC family protein [Methylophilaceae bacterium]
MKFYKLTMISLGIAIALGGCASFSADGGLGDVKKITAQHIKQEVVWAKNLDAQKQASDQVSALLNDCINADEAVQIALLNNKGLQAAFYDLGISEADIVQAGRLPNPKFSMLYARNNGDYKIEQALTFNIFSLIVMPRILAVERQNFEKTKQHVALEVLKLAFETRMAYFNAVAANQHLDYSEQVKESAEASAELAKRMVKAGNWSALEQANEQNYYAQAMQEFSLAKQQKVNNLEALSRTLGVAPEMIQLQERLPYLPKTTAVLQTIEKDAFKQRLDLQAMRQDTESLAKQLGLTKTTRFINVLEIGPARVLEGQRSDPYKKGVDISFELPLFDWGGAKVARAEAVYMQAVNRAAQLVTNAQSEIRVAHSQYLTSYEIAKQYRDDIVPLSKKVSEENLLRYNGMLISPFTLFTDARAQVNNVNTYISKLHEFWLADTALQRSLTSSMEKQ